jgi:AraC-like DNA-binding protein
MESVMRDNSSENGAGDRLTEILRDLRLDGVDYGRRHLEGAWAFAFPAKGDAMFHFIGGKGCWLKRPTGEWMELLSGDAVLIPRGDAHALASAPGAVPTPFPLWRCEPLGTARYDPRAEQSEARHLLLNGSMRFNLDRLHPLFALMPDVLRANELMRHEPDTGYLLEALGREMASNRVGGAGIVSRLADVLAAQIIRSWVEYGHNSAEGWIAAVKDRQIGRVLVAMHRHPGCNWTIESLAEVMGASRASFAAKFVAVVGSAPADYLRRVRMSQAKLWLSGGKATITEAAFRLGYRSEASFSRAFKKTIGAPPSHYVRKADAT